MKPSHRVAAVSIAILLITACFVRAQGPALTVSAPEDGSKPQQLTISDVKVRTVIVGSIAETEMTMTFSNPHKRDLSGDFYFPLPEGATVNGYALDVKGVMVDGVVVDKEKARVAFETEVRRGIDPGLVEWTKGNNFKTRIFPIPAQGQRTARVRFISDIVHSSAGARYQIPLSFKHKVKSFSIRIEVLKSGEAPDVTRSGLKELKFTPWHEGFLALAEAADIMLNEDLEVILPPVKSGEVFVQKASDGSNYFCINAALPELKVPVPVSPRKVIILWDASRSRTNSELEKEIDVLKAFFARHSGTDVEVDLVFFSNTASPVKTYVVSNGRIEELVRALTLCTYDGGTQVGSLSEVFGIDEPDYYLLFSDGISNYGREEPDLPRRPIYAFSSGTLANHAFLRQMTVSTGGEYFNLKNVKAEDAIKRIGISPPMITGISAAPGAVEGICPGGPELIQNSVTIVGRLKAEKAAVTCGYGFAGREVIAASYEIRSKDAGEGDLLRRYWAQKRINELMVFQERNSAEIRELGRAHGIVTPSTSLIVMEDISQYVRHRIMPPATLPQMREEYKAKVAEEDSRVRQIMEQNIERAVALWKTKVEWWEKEFAYPEDFDYLKELKKREVLENLNITEENHNASEGVVLRALRWLKSQAQTDGSWGQDVRDTSLSLLAFLGHGETPSSREFGDVVELSIKYLLAAQEESGRFGTNLVSHAIASHALNETYGMTRIPDIKYAAEKATSYLIREMKNVEEPNGWHASALKSAMLAGIELEGMEEAVRNTRDKLKKQQSPGALVGLQLLGDGATTEARNLLASISGMTFDWQQYDMETLRFVTKANFFAGGDAWSKWNRIFSPFLVSNQTVVPVVGNQGRVTGFWDAPHSVDRAAGKVHNTATACSMLEVYYRYLPTFTAHADYLHEDTVIDFEQEGFVGEAVVMRSVYGSRSPGARGAALSAGSGGGSSQAGAGGGVLPGPAEHVEPAAKAAISLAAWVPDAPYVSIIMDAAPGDRYAEYLNQRLQYGNAPAFFLDCADIFLKEGDRVTGLRILSNIVEFDVENAALLRVLAHRLAQIDALDDSIAVFREVLRMRPEEPQSHRDLALVLERKGEFYEAAKLLYGICEREATRFPEIENIVLMELNAILPKLNKDEVAKLKMDPRLIKPLDVDIRIVLTWDTDLVDLDLWVTEPSGEKACYSHNTTTTGGAVSRDFTQGYGPEQYYVRKAMKGSYKIEADYFGTTSSELLNPVTLQVDVFTNYGRPDQERKTITRRLAKAKDKILVGEITF